MKRLRNDIDDLITQFFGYSKNERRGVTVIALAALGFMTFLLLSPDVMPDKSHLAAIDSVGKAQSAEYYAKFRRPGHDVKFPSKTFTAYPPGRTFSRKSKVYIEINGADSAGLRSVRGVGEVITRSIMAYRKRLGGFVELSQLREVYGIDDNNFDSISKQFYIDSAVIQKIDINFAPLNELINHPYITKNMAERVVKGRNSKGGWKNIRELTDNDILLPEEARRVARYLVFN